MKTELEILIKSDWSASERILSKELNFEKVEFPVENIVPIVTPQINTLTIHRIRHSKVKPSPIGLID